MFHIPVHKTQNADNDLTACHLFPVNADKPLTGYWERGTGELKLLDKFCKCQQRRYDHQPCFRVKMLNMYKHEPDNLLPSDKKWFYGC